MSRHSAKWVVKTSSGTIFTGRHHKCVNFCKAFAKSNPYIDLNILQKRWA